MRTVHWSVEHCEYAERHYGTELEPGWMVVEVKPGGDPHDLDDVRWVEACGFETESEAWDWWLRTLIFHSSGAARERNRRALEKLQAEQAAQR